MNAETKKLMDETESECRRFLSMYTKESRPGVCRRALQPILDSMLKITSALFIESVGLNEPHNCGNPNCFIFVLQQMIKETGRKIVTICPLMKLKAEEDERRFIAALPDVFGQADIVRFTMSYGPPKVEKVSLEDLTRSDNISAIDIVENLLMQLHNQHASVVATQAPAQA